MDNHSQEAIDTSMQISEEIAKVPASDSDLALMTSKYARLSATDIRLVLELHESGATQTDIAKVIGCSQSTISTTLKVFDSTGERVAKQLKAFTDETIEDWRDARKVAAKRGDHRPAREMLEAAYPELRPQPVNTGNHAGVTVIVAVPGGGENPRPAMTISTSKVLEVSPVHNSVVGEGPRIPSAIASGSHKPDSVNQD